MKNRNGELIYGGDEIKEEAIKHYSKVFTDRPMVDSMKHIKKERKTLCMARIEKTQTKQDNTMDN